jgi:integrase
MGRVLQKNGGGGQKSMARDRLTSLGVKNTTAPGIYHDGGGLYLQVSPLSKGSKSWFLRYRINGKVRDMGLGSVADWKLADIRERAKLYRRMVDDKIDPIDHRNAQRDAHVAESEAREAAKAKRKSFEECATICFEARKSKWKNPKHRAQWISTLKTYAFPTIGNLDIRLVGKQELKSLLEPIWLKKPETADRVFQRIRTVFEWASAGDHLDKYDAKIWKDVITLLGGPREGREVRHFAACPYAEVGNLVREVHATSISEMLKLCFEFMILTAGRSAEVRGAKKSEIDLDKKTWTVEATRMKMGIEHVVPLSDRAVEIVRQTLALAPKGELLFPGPKGKLPFSDQAFTKVVLRENLAVTYTAHGFRSSFRTWAGEKTNYERVVCERALAHDIKTDTEVAYDRSDYEKKRRGLMQAWADYISSTATDLDAAVT